MLLSLVLLIFGFFLLIKGADLLVDGGVATANKFRVPTIVTGLTVVAFGTSMPELVVSLFAGYKGTSDIALGNIIGSNISNILLILGTAAVLAPITLKKNTSWKEVPLSLLAAVVLFVLINDSMLGEATASIISRGDGIVLLAFFAIFMTYVFSISKNDKTFKCASEPKEKSKSVLKSLTHVILGVTIMSIGGNFIIDGAQNVARFFGLSEALIGLTIIAVGTSLPELATVIVASRKKHSDLAIGNIIGSNIFNIFWVLGATAIISPISLNPSMNYDMLVLIVISILLFFLVLIGKKHYLSKRHGFILIAFYFLYLLSKITIG